MPEQAGELNAGIIYLCSPNNPTGAVYNREQLSQWVDYALATGAIILFDSAYEMFVQDGGEIDKIPSSIYQIRGARECAIEFCSLSKTAGFSGTRCGYTVVPQELIRSDISLNKMWRQRQSAKFNAVPYIVQRGAEAAFSEDGMAQIKWDINYYLTNANMLSDSLRNIGIRHSGGRHSPYVWFACPNNMDSWQFYEFLLKRAKIAGMPGAAYGEQGERYFRLSAFGDRGSVMEAIERLVLCMA